MNIKLIRWGLVFLRFAGTLDLTDTGIIFKNKKGEVVLQTRFDAIQSISYNMMNRAWYIKSSSGHVSFAIPSKPDTASFAAALETHQVKGRVLPYENSDS